LLENSRDHPKARPPTQNHAPLGGLGSSYRQFVGLGHKKRPKNAGPTVFQPITIQDNFQRLWDRKRKDRRKAEQKIVMLGQWHALCPLSQRHHPCAGSLTASQPISPHSLNLPQTSFARPSSAFPGPTPHPSRDERAPFIFTVICKIGFPRIRVKISAPAERQGSPHAPG
jgi:hypothetical protein